MGDFVSGACRFFNVAASRFAPRSAVYEPQYKTKTISAGFCVRCVPCVRSLRCVHFGKRAAAVK